MHDWRTSDEDEVNRRRLRGREESFQIRNLFSKRRVYSNFEVISSSGMTYEVEVRDLVERRHACSCVDFRTNGLGHCKHVEAVLLYIERRFPRLFKSAGKKGSDWIEIELDQGSEALRLFSNGNRVPVCIRRCFNKETSLADEAPEVVLETYTKNKKRLLNVRVSMQVRRWIENRRIMSERTHLRQVYEQKVQSGEWPHHETLVPLYPYQREGMLHLAFNERALLADEMGLGKTIQAIAACALLHRLGKASRVLVVTPASLKSEWEEQIQKFTPLTYQIVFGPRHDRLKKYDQPTFFNLVNYEQMLVDSLDVNRRLQPDIIVLDEAQRIKNWNTKTAQAVKRLESRYAFVLTGTPIENRIDELHSLMDFLNPEVLGPLFRFNRDFYQLDERGRPSGYRNLELLKQKVSPHMVRRRKSDVEKELPERTDHLRFVEMSDLQWEYYDGYKKIADRLMAIAKQRPLRKEEMEMLQVKLAQMRMTCDTNYIQDPSDETCPKLNELRAILEEAMENNAKVLVFSEWERMLTLARNLCEEMGLSYAWHTGKVPQKKRRGEINAFKTDPRCMVFFSTDSGSTGLNLQNASIVVNCDLPWNPAKLEQRIARAWRKHQPNAVTVYNLVSEGTIEHGMIGTLSSKQALADGVLDGVGDLGSITMSGGRQAFLQRLEQVMSKAQTSKKSGSEKAVLPADRAMAFGKLVSERLGDSLIRCEERYPKDSDHSVIVVVADQVVRHQHVIQEIFQECLDGDQRKQGDRTQLEVIDRATAEALDRLEKAGLIAPTFRSSRPLLPCAEVQEEQQPSFTAAELKSIKEYRAGAKRKLKMARVLADAELFDEVRPPILDAASLIMKMLAVYHHKEMPEDILMSIKPPFSFLWGESLQDIKAFFEKENGDAQSLAEALDHCLHLIHFEQSQ